MAYMRVNNYRLKEGFLEDQLQEVRDFAANNDPDETGLIGNIMGVGETSNEVIAITIWTDKEKFEASSARWPGVMESMAHMIDGEPKRTEVEILTHSIPLEKAK